MRLPRQLYKHINNISRISCRCLHETAVKDDHVVISGTSYRKDHMTNISPTILSKLHRKLHLQKDHPLEIVKSRIVEHFHANYRSRFGGCIFASIDNLNPIVTTQQNFDTLLVPDNHVSRSKNDNYYINSDYVLRSHTTAHENDLIRSGWNAYLNCGDCYRRDEIDRSHYPVFHQLEGVRMFDDNELFQDTKDSTLHILEKKRTQRTVEKQEHLTLDATKTVEFHLKHTLTRLVEYLFGDDVEMRWVDAYFPFTHPSWELEIKLGGEWIEMLGCGILEQQIMQNAGAGNQIAWAFGLGLERFAMKLYDIPDIRLFWSEDKRFLSQFQAGLSTKFKPFSKYPPSDKDISFWINQEAEFSANDLFEIARLVAGEVIEEEKGASQDVDVKNQMELIDEFQHPKTSLTSVCYRIRYRAMDRTLTDEEVNALQDEIRYQVEKNLPVTLR